MDRILLSFIPFAEWLGNSDSRGVIAKHVWAHRLDLLARYISAWLWDKIPLYPRRPRQVVHVPCCSVLPLSVDVVLDLFNINDRHF